MLPFLQYAAKEIIDTTENKNFENTIIVLPSKRAVYFFKKSFALLSNGTFYAPKILSIDDFIVSVSGLEIIENVELYLKAFEFWKKIDESQTLELFITWIPTLIKDFENIDFALLQEPHQLFKYMSEAKSIERWEIEDNFQFSDTTKGYFSFFDKVAVVYEQLKNDLINTNKAYRGLAYRIAANKIIDSESNSNKFYFFVGLNALTNSEEFIVKLLVKKRKAACIWDTDDFYMNHTQKAGKKLLSYKKSNLFGEWNTQFSLLQNTPKNFKVYNTLSENLQITLVKNLLKESPVNHVVIVLDEKLFLPLIYLIPNEQNKINISVGLPITQSRLNSFFSIILNCFNDFYSLNRISNANLTLLYSNYHFKKIFHKLTIEQDFNGNTKAFFDKNELIKSNNVICKTIASGDNIVEFLSMLHAIFEKFVIIESNNDLEQAFLKTLIPKIDILINQINNGLEINFKTLQVLFNEFLKNEKIPFESEFESPIQVMSLLESRCLDFENVTFLSFSEGNLPSNTKQNSFIPNDAAYFFKLPIYEDQDAIMAYHFLRLLQRARNINFIYSSGGGAKGVGGKEKSRFLSIIENQLINSKNQISISYPQILFNKSGTEIIPTFEVINKTEHLVSKVKGFLTERGLSATSLNDYLSCSFKFYLKNIENLKPEPEIEKNIGNDIIGQIVHKVLEKIDKDLPIKDLKKLHYEKSIIREYSEKIFELQKDKFEIQFGLNLIIKTIVGKLLEDYYGLRIKEFQEGYKVIGNEIHLSNCIKINDLDIKIKGTIDKIEKHKGHIAVIDFKTGKVENKDLKFEISADNSDFLYEPKRDKIRQLLMYDWLLENDPEQKEIMGSANKLVLIIYSFRNLHEKISIDSAVLEEAKKQKVFEKLVIDVVENLLNQSLPFIKTQDKTQCTFCDYKNICFRD